MASSIGDWICNVFLFLLIMSFILVDCEESPHLETVFPSTIRTDVKNNGPEISTSSDTEASSLSEPHSAASVDGTGSENDAGSQSTDNAPTSSRAVTFEELIFGIERADRSDLKLTLSNLFDEQNRAGGNGTDKSRRIHCVPRNITAVPPKTLLQKVELVNSSELLLRLSQKNETQGNCAVVMFYAPWCMFCARAAPHYSALARAFPQMDILAIDAVHFSSLNSRYGTIAVPNILVFHNAKAVARFNSSTRTFSDMVSFVSNVTGLTADESASIRLEDYQGPLSSVPSNERDLLLWLSWLFVLVFSGTVFAKSPRGQLVWNFVVNFGAEHEHID